MPFSYTGIKRYKKGAPWDDGSSRMCTRCGVEGRRKRKTAKVIALLAHDTTDYVLPVGYCKEHTPEGLKQ